MHASIAFLFSVIYPLRHYLEKAGKEINPEKRKELYSEFQKIIVDDLPVYWTNTLPYHTIYNKKVGDPPLGIWATSSPMDMTYIKK